MNRTEFVRIVLVHDGVATAVADRVGVATHEERPYGA